MELTKEEKEIIFSDEITDEDYRPIRHIYKHRILLCYDYNLEIGLYKKMIYHLKRFNDYYDRLYRVDNFKKGKIYVLTEHLFKS